MCVCARALETPQKIVQRQNGSSEKDPNGVARVRSLKPSRGNAKHVTVLKESARSEVRRVHKACPYAVQRALTYYRIFYFVIPQSPVSLPLCCSCFLDYPRAYLTRCPFPRASESSRVRRVEWSPTDIRYSITGHRVSLRINYKLSSLPTPFLFVGQYPRFNYLGVIFVSFKQPCGNSERYVNASPVRPLNCDLAMKIYRTCTRCRKIYCGKQLHPNHVIDTQMSQWQNAS